MNNNDILKNLKIIRTVSIQSNFPLKIQLIEMNKATNEQNVSKGNSAPSQKSNIFIAFKNIFIYGWSNKPPPLARKMPSRLF